MEKISVIIPAYNEGKTLRRIVEKVLAVPLLKEIIIVDDGSSDDTPAVMEELAKHRERGPLFAGYSLLHHAHNGKGSALKLGIAHASGSIVVFQDADLEYDPDDIPTLIEPIVSGRTEIVLGVRVTPSQELQDHKPHYWMSWLGNLCITKITNLLFWNNAGEYEGCYKAITKRLLDTISVQADGFDFDNELVCKILKQGLKTVDVPVRYYPRNYSEGKKFRSWRHGFLILRTIVKTRLSG